MKRAHEKQLITDYIKDRLVESGWTFVPGKDLNRSGIEEPLLIANLRASLFKLNAHLGITEKEVDDVIQEVKLVPRGETGARQMLHYLKYGVGVKFYRDKIVKIVSLFDFEHPENNEFILSREVAFKGAESVRADIVCYVNGIPLVNAEGKNPLSLSVSWEDAYRQIKRYERIAGEAYKYIQIGVAADAEARYFAIAPWMDDVGTYEWKEEGLDAVDAMVEFLKPAKVLDMIRNFLFVREERGSYDKVIARYMQVRAANKICGRVADYLEGKDDRNKGLIWHWQGSGKTLTMIFAGHKLYFDRRLEAPSIFFIIDRKELEEQLSNELSSLDVNFAHETVGSVEEMTSVVRADGYKGKRGVFVTLLHKFESGRQWLPADFDGQGGSTIADRKNVICFLDEVHRTQYGLLAAQMKHVLRSAFYFGFTGTPVDEEERDTYRTFGYPLDREDYLDKYFIDESLADGFTVPVVFLPRQEKLHYSEELLKAIQAADEEEPFGGEEVEDKIARALGIRDAFLENEQRIKKISEDIAGHFWEYVDGRFKAMVVCGSRKACVFYKRELDALLGGNVSEIVMTFNVGDQRMLSDAHETWKARYPSAKNDKDVREEIVRRFKSGAETDPKILIVTDMLLTGFDAPILQTMYFDKPLKKHRLLQAVARVNRLFGGMKAAGIIVDYAGIFKEARKAHERYYEDERGTTVPFDYDYLEERFKKLMQSVKEIVGRAPDSFTREKLVEAMDCLRDEKAEKMFTETYRELRNLFELLGCGDIKLEYLEQYRFYSAMFDFIQKLKRNEDRDIRNAYLSKTIKAMHQAIAVEEIRKDAAPIAFDLDYFRSLTAAKDGKKEKAMNMVFGLERFVLVEQSGNPVLRTVLEKVQELVRKWREKSVDYEELYDEGSAVLAEIDAKEKEKRAMGLSDIEFGIHEIFVGRVSGEMALRTAKDICVETAEYRIHDWETQAVLRQHVSRLIREIVRKLKAIEKISLEDIDRLSQEIFDFMEEYASKQGR